MCTVQSARIAPVRAVGVITDRNAIHYEQGLVAARQGSDAADVDVGRGTGQAAGSCDVNPGNLTLQGVHYVWFGSLGNFFAFKLLGCIAQCALVFLDAEGRYHYFAQFLHIGNQTHTECGLTTNDSLLGNVAHRAESQCAVPIWYG